MGFVIGIDSNEDFHREILEAHNECRKKHNTQELVWSTELARQAQEWADQIAELGKFEHAPLQLRKGQGENISCAGGKELTAADATNMWYQEVKDFNFKSCKYNSKCGHFSQVVWANTKEIGAGKSTAKNGLQFIVCRYSPPGNMANGFEENVKSFGIKKNSSETDDNSNLTNQDDTRDSSELGEDITRIQQPTTTLIPSCKVLFQGMNLKFEMKIIEENKELQPFRHETVEIKHLKAAYKDPYYKSRTYLQQGIPYHVLLYCQ